MDYVKAIAAATAVIVVATVVQYYWWNQQWLDFKFLPIHWFALAEGIFPLVKRKNQQQQA
ncbi:MAG: hypothetical protein AB1331_08520 [Bacillota bacterium]